MSAQILDRCKMKIDYILSVVKYCFFLTVIFLSMGCIELKAAEMSDVNNPGVEKVELDLQPGSAYAIPVWQALPGNDEWVFNYHYIYMKDLAHMSNVMEYGKMTLKAYPDDENFGTQPGWSDWKVETEWIVSGDSGVVMLKGGSYNEYGIFVPGEEEPEGTGCVNHWDDDAYYEETAVIIPTGKPGTVTVSAKVIDKNGKEILGLPGKKITVKRWLDINPDIKITEVASGRTVHIESELEDGYGLTNRDQQTMSRQTYTGKPITPKIMVTDKGEALVEGKDYTLSYINNVDVGYWSLDHQGAAILITGCGDYSGIIELHFSIDPDYSNQPQPEPEKKLSCTGTYKKTLDTKTFKLNVKNAKGTVSYTSSNKEVATVNSKGIVTLKGTGLAKITIKASNGSVVSKVYVAPKKASISKAKSTAKKTVTVTWKKDTKATGYEIQCNTNKKFKSGNKTVTVKKAKTTSAKVTKLKSGKKYYVRMRSYKTISGKKYAGSWSKVLTVKVK